MARGICHWGPILALSIIITLFLTGLYGMTLVYPPWSSLWSMLQLCVYLTWLFLILLNFLKAIWLGPGYVPKNWMPENKDDTKFLQHCHVCEGYKTPRAHHCSKCSRCVMKMDHHCPWINNCVGHKNIKSFTLFLFFVPPGCIHCAIILGACIYHQIYKLTDPRSYRYMNSDDNIVLFGIYHLILIMFCFGLAIGVTIAVGTLLYYQIKGIKLNQTAIESWIVEKAVNRARPEGGVFVYPYNLGWKENFKQVIFNNRDYQGDGITWPVCEGCHQYTLTLEQLWQKELKRERTVTYHVIKPYNGSLLAWREGFWTCISTPCTDETRMKIDVGDVMMVTRWRKYWMYGERRCNLGNGSKSGFDSQKGWFPRHCVIRETDFQEEVRWSGKKAE